MNNDFKLEFYESPVDKKWLGCHIETPGYQLDDYHIVTKLTDRNGIVSWGLFTFPNPIKNGIIEYSQNLKNTEIWHMDEIDPNDFEWNGQKFILKEMGRSVRKKYIKGKGILVGTFTESDIDVKTDRKAVDKAMAETGLKYTNAELVYSMVK